MVSYQHSVDPLGVWYRPGGFYAVVKLMSNLFEALMRAAGYRKETAGALSYWYAPPLGFVVARGLSDGTGCFMDRAP